MKVYSQPEVLEEHIAPAALSVLPDGTIAIMPEIIATVSNGPIDGISNGNNIAPIVVSPAISLIGPIVMPPVEPLVLSDHLSDFHIRTIRVGADPSLIGEAAIDLQDTGFQSLLGDFGVESTLSDSALSSLAEDLRISTDVGGAIESAVAEDRSAALVGLSSEEFERASGSAFLTSL